MKVTEKAVKNILGYMDPPVEEKCNITGRHKYHKGIGKGKQCVYCGYLKR